MASRRSHPDYYTNRAFATEGHDYTDDELEFMKAMDRYKRENRRPHPTCTEVLAVMKSLGYRKVEVKG